MGTSVFYLEDYKEKRTKACFNVIHERNVESLTQISDLLNYINYTIEEIKLAGGEEVMKKTWKKLGKNERMELKESFAIIRKQIHDIEKEITLK